MPKSRSRKKSKRAKRPTYDGGSQVRGAHSQVSAATPSTDSISEERTPHAGCRCCVPPKMHSPLHEEIWAVVSTYPSGMGSISSGLTYADAYAEAQTRYAERHGGVVVMTAEAANNIGAIPFGEVLERRDPKTPLVRDAGVNDIAADSRGLTQIQNL